MFKLKIRLRVTLLRKVQLKIRLDHASKFRMLWLLVRCLKRVRRPKNQEISLKTILW